MRQPDIEKSIGIWKKSLFKYKGFEPADIDELEDHFRSMIDDLRQQGYSEIAAFEKAKEDFSDQYDLLDKAYHSSKTISSFNEGLLFGFLKVAIRSLKRQWSYSLINILGLAIGLGSVMAICGYVIGEFGYDHFNTNKSELNRVINEYDRESGTLRYPLAPPALAPAINGTLPGIRQVTRLRTIDRIVLSNEDQDFLEKRGFYADSSFLSMFSFELLEGNSMRVLSQPNSIVLTRSMADKLFPNRRAMGQILKMNGERLLEVTGVLQDLSYNSHLQFDFLISFQTYQVPEGYLADLNSWGWMGFLTYVRIDDAADKAELEEQLRQLYKTHNTSKSNKDIRIKLQPLTEIYLGSGKITNPHGGLFKSNNRTNLYSLMAIAGLILLIAGFNYVNINIANVQTRIKEVGMRRVLGSSRTKLVMQIITEAIVNVAMASFIGLFIALLIFKTGIIPQSVFLFASPIYFGILVLGCVALGAILGAIIALASRTFIAGSSTLGLLKSSPISGSSMHYVNNAILFGQYLIAAGLIATSIIVVKQINFMNNKELGYNAHGIMAISGTSESINSSYNLFEKLAQSEPSIKDVTLCSHAFDGGSSGGPMRRDSWSEDQQIHTAYYQVGFNFLQTTGIELIQGRFFSNKIPSDSTASIVLNEEAARAMNIRQLNGQKIIFNNGHEYRVIGIVKNFHFRSLHHRIEPMALVMPFGNVENVLVSFQSPDLTAVYGAIEQLWNEASNDINDPVSIEFLDVALAQQYKKEAQLEIIVRSFSFLAILLSCVGLLGLTAVTINLKIRQVCIRKILGAGSGSIIVSICRGSLVCAVGATIIAWPLAIFVSNIWLADYAYHYQPDISIFLITFLVVMPITLLTLSIQYRKVNFTNPAKILRND